MCYIYPATFDPNGVVAAAGLYMAVDCKVMHRPAVKVGWGLALGLGLAYNMK